LASPRESLLFSVVFYLGHLSVLIPYSPFGGVRSGGDPLRLSIGLAAMAVKNVKTGERNFKLSDSDGLDLLVANPGPGI